jgi:hypothetical protein
MQRLTRDRVPPNSYLNEQLSEQRKSEVLQLGATSYASCRLRLCITPCWIPLTLLSCVKKTLVSPLHVYKSLSRTSRTSNPKKNFGQNYLVPSRQHKFRHRGWSGLRMRSLVTYIPNIQIQSCFPGQLCCAGSHQCWFHLQGRLKSSPRLCKKTRERAEKPARTVVG